MGKGPGMMGQRPGIFQALRGRCGNRSEGREVTRVAVPSSRVASYEDDTRLAEGIRRDLARELHDRVTQTLTTMLIELENFKVEQTGRQSVLRQLDELQGSTRDVLNNLRTVLYDLRGEEGIEVAFIESVHGLLAKFEERTQVIASLSVAPTWPTSLRAPAALNIYRIIEEALTNMRLHSG